MKRHKLSGDGVRDDDREVVDQLDATRYRKGPLLRSLGAGLTAASLAALLLWWMKRSR